MAEEIVLLIDPDEVERRRLQRAFASEGFQLLEAESAIEGLFETLERDPVLILLAEQVPPLAAGELLLVLRRITEAPVIVIGSGDEPEEGSVLELGAAFYLRRPFGDRVAVARARSLIRRYLGSLERERLASRLGARRNGDRLVSDRPMLLDGGAGRRAAS